MKSKTLLTVLMILAIGLAVFPQNAAASGDTLTLTVEQVDLSAFPTITLRLSAWGPDGLPPVEIFPAELSITETAECRFQWMTSPWIRIPRYRLPW